MASWMSIMVTLAFQVVLVPVFLKYWDVKTYGAWILITSIVNIVSTIDRGHVDYLGYEFLKTDEQKKSYLGKLLLSGLFTNIVIVAIEFVALFFLIYGNKAFFNLFGGELRFSSLLWYQVKVSLVIQFLIWAVFTSNLGLLYRFLFNYGYFPRYSWQNIASTILSMVASIIAVVLGCNLLQTTIYSAGTTALFSIFQGYDLLRLLKKERIPLNSYSYRLAGAKFSESLLFSLRSFLENIRQQGIRLIIIPFVGTSGLASFVTMRTGANVSLQGLSTITNPLLPELMRFLKQKEQKKIDASLSLVWFVLAVLLAPGVVLLQYAAPKLFYFWVKGHIIFDPLLFAFLSMGVLVYAIAQPGMAIIKGNNLLKTQMLIAVLSSVVLVVALFLLVPRFNILGAGISLLLAEIVAAIGYLYSAKKWMREIHLVFPECLHRICTVSLFIAGISMMGMAYFVGAEGYVLLISELLLLINIIRFWRKLPDIAVCKINIVQHTLQMKFFGQVK